MDPIVKQITVNSTIEKVWSYLTDANKLEQWLMPNNFEAELNKKFSFRCIGHKGSEQIIECELLEVDPYKKLVFSWYTENIGINTKVTIDLKEVDDEVVITLTHSGWGKLDARLKHIRDEYNNGWEGFIKDNLKSALNIGNRH